MFVDHILSSLEDIEKIVEVSEGIGLDIALPPGPPEAFLVLEGGDDDGALETAVWANNTLSISFLYADGILRLLAVEAVRDNVVPMDEIVDDDVVRWIGEDADVVGSCC